MAIRKPIVQIDGVLQELSSTDSLGGSSSAPVLLEISVVNGDLIANYIAVLAPSLVNGELIVSML
jgi:hypothetical protein